MSRLFVSAVLWPNEVSAEIMKTKVIILTETISPYRIPVFNEIAKRLSDQFMVIFMGKSEKRRQWRIYKENIKFRYEVLPNILFQRKGATPYFFNPSILYQLIKYSPETIIVSGYAQPSSFLAMLYAKLFAKRLILWCESNKYDQRFNHQLQEAYKRWFVRNCAEYIVPGKASFEYLTLLGADESKVCIVGNAVDNDFFADACAKNKNSSQAFKQKKGYPEKIILYVGRLVDEKGILDLLKSFQLLIRSGHHQMGLVLIGSGEGEEKYRKFCNDQDIKNIFFEGFLHQEDLPAYYAASDVFVLPTHSEPWGLVINEAMASSLPVVCSDVSGAAYDLIKNAENGYTYKKGNIKELAKNRWGRGLMRSSRTFHRKNAPWVF
jgi:glycosyltransferase involved in cell wall biosynthesis